MTIRLITIPISHYCEKARWALERAGLTYQEEPHLQVFHYLASLRAGRSYTVPVLVYPGGILRDSSDILRWVDARHSCVPRLYPERQRLSIQRLERYYDAELGPSGRLWMYHLLLPHREVAERYGTYGIPAWQRVAVRPEVFNMVRWVIRARLGIDPTNATAARQRARQIFDEVEMRLSDGRPFLMGDAFTAADLTFASLSAPLVLPSEYGVPLPPDHDLPETYQLELRVWREHPAGAFALRMFREQRRVLVGARSRPVDVLAN